MTTFEALSVMIGFSTLIVTITCVVIYFFKKKVNRL